MMKSMIQFVVFDWLDGFLEKKEFQTTPCTCVTDRTHLKLKMQCFIISLEPDGVPAIIVLDIK